VGNGPSCQKQPFGETAKSSEKGRFRDSVCLDGTGQLGDQKFVADYQNQSLKDKEAKRCSLYFYEILGVSQKKGDDLIIEISTFDENDSYII